MSYFRNFGNVVCSQTFTRPNNLVLRSCYLPKTLVESSQPSINHLHSVKALLITIQSLKSYQSSIQGQYLQQVRCELQYLKKCQQQYRISIKKYVQSNGYLTGEGIANLYTSASYLGFDSTWLQNYVHNQIENKVAYMSKANLEDVIQGLNTYHSNSETLNKLKKILADKSTAENQYVTRIVNQINQFQYCDNVKSNHQLIRAIKSDTAFPLYTGFKWWGLVWGRVMTYFGEQPKYYLHSQ